MADYDMMTPYLDSFMFSNNNNNTNSMIKNKDTYIPLNGTGAGAAGTTNNMKLGDPNNYVDTRSNPTVTAVNNLTNNNANIDAAYGNSSFAVNVEGQRRPQNKPVDIFRPESMKNIGLPELEEVNQPTDTYKKLMPMGDTTADDLINKYNPAFIDERKVEEMARNNIGNQTFSEGGADLAWESSKPVAAPTLDSLNKDSMLTASEVAVPVPEGGGGMMDKLKGIASSETIGTALAFSPLLGMVDGIQQRKAAIKNLEDSKNSTLSALGGLANAKELEDRSIADQYSEDVRRVGALENEQMSAQLEKIAGAKTGGLVSGSQKEMSDDVVDASSTKVDIQIAKLSDERASAEARSLSASKQERQKLNQTIKEIDAKIKEAQREQITGPLKSVIDVGSNLLMASNPALAIGMQVGKSLIS